MLVGVNDKVFAGEPLIRLEDDEARARIATAEAQIALRKRARNDQSTSAGAAERRRAEDWVAEAERGVFEAQASVRPGGSGAAAATALRGRCRRGADGLAREQDRLKQRRAELRSLEDDKSTPLPTQNEGELNVARAELLLAKVGLEKLTIRAPIAGTVLQVNAKAGELAAPSAIQPLMLIGDISALRVRAELDERDFGEIKVGQPVAGAGCRVSRAANSPAKSPPSRRSSMPGASMPATSAGLSDVRVVEVLVDLAEPAAARGRHEGGCIFPS